MTYNEGSFGSNEHTWFNELKTDDSVANSLFMNSYMKDNTANASGDVLNTWLEVLAVFYFILLLFLTFIHKGFCDAKE